MKNRLKCLVYVKKKNVLHFKFSGILSIYIKFYHHLTNLDIKGALNDLILNFFHPEVHFSIQIQPLNFSYKILIVIKNIPYFFLYLQLVTGCTRINNEAFQQHITSVAHYMAVNTNVRLQTQQQHILPSTNLQKFVIKGDETVLSRMDMLFQ